MTSLSHAIDVWVMGNFWYVFVPELFMLLAIAGALVRK